MSQDPLFSEDELEAARVLFARQASFLMGAVSVDGLPPGDLPEVAFAGRSNVGKSSLLNALFPELALETGGLAKKTDRGKHTTRQAELWPYLGGAVLDTPGFSLFEMSELEQSALDASYPEFAGVTSECRFTGCRHVAEPDCAVKALLQTGKLSQDRYARYIEIQAEIEDKRKHRYD